MGTVLGPSVLHTEAGSQTNCQGGAVEHLWAVHAVGAILCDVLSSCMFDRGCSAVQVPSMAANPLNVRKRIISKSFHRILDTYNRQTFTGTRGFSWVAGWMLVLETLVKLWVPVQATPSPCRQHRACIHVSGWKGHVPCVSTLAMCPLPVLAIPCRKGGVKSCVFVFVSRLQVPLRLCVTT